MKNEALESAQYFRDLVYSGDATRELLKLLITMQESQVGHVLDEMARGRDKEGNLLPQSEYSFRSGMIEGLRWLTYEVDHQLRTAVKADEEKNEGDQETSLV